MQNGGYTCACSTQTDYASYPAGPLAPCRPGEFYLRELPPLRAVLDDLSGVAGLLVVDGYTDLDPGDRPGLAVPPARTAPRPPPRTRP